jgi:hypothetical protein
MTLRGTKTAHKHAAEREMREARRRLDSAMKAIKEGSCTKAYMNVVEMWQALGRVEADGRWAGGTPWVPASEIQELGYQFSTRCLRDTPMMLGARPRRRRR